MDEKADMQENWHAVIEAVSGEPDACILRFSKEQIRKYMFCTGDTNWQLHDIDSNSKAMVPGGLIISTAAAGPVCALFPGKLFCGVESSKIRRPVLCSRGVVKVKYEELLEKSAEGFTRLRLLVTSESGATTHVEAVIFVRA